MNQMNIKRLEQQLINSNTQKKINNKTTTHKNFEDVLENIKENEEIKFSRHAKTRLTDRNIKLSEEDLKKLDSAFKQAEVKGVEDALILMEDQAFIASVTNKTIITAIENDKMKDNVFTNIDGAVII